MPAAPDFATRRFQSAAAHYLAGRPAYPPGLIERTAGLIGLTPSDRLMDLGCGPAQLGVAFAPHVAEVLALDPEPAMLALARQAARGVPNLTVAEGRSDDLGPAMGRFQAVVIGRAFHWMDRADTLRRLDAIIEPGGAVVLFGDERGPAPGQDWVRAYAALIERWSAEDESRAHRRSDAFASHISVLLASPFHRLERISLIAPHTVSVDALVDRALSQSSTSRARLGERADAMVEELRREAEGWGPTLTEVLTSSALIARRPDP